MWIQSYINSVSFNRSYVPKISNDLYAFSNSFPALRPNLVQTPGQPTYIEFFGPVDMFYGTMKYSLNLLVQITHAFPYQPPFYTFANNSQRILPSSVLDPNGVIKVASIIQWNPNLSLVDSTKYILNYFNTNPPIDLRQPPLRNSLRSSGTSDNCSLLANEAQEIIDEHNSAAKKLYEEQTKLAMLTHLKKIMSELPKEEEKKIQDFYMFPPQVEADINKRAKEEASRETINALKNNLLDGTLTMKPADFLNKLDKLDREHFNNYIWPRISISAAPK